MSTDSPQAYVPFRCAGCQTAREMLQLDLPASARLAIWQIIILSTMFTEAIFVGHNEVKEDCFVACPEMQWLLRRLMAMIFAFLLAAPAETLLYVSKPVSVVASRLCVSQTVERASRLLEVKQWLSIVPRMRGYVAVFLLGANLYYARISD